MMTGPRKSAAIPQRGTQPDLAEHQQERRSPSGLSRDRLQVILHRFTTGYYDTPAVRGCVAERLGEEWSSDSA